MNLSSKIDIIPGGTPKTDIKEYWNGNIPWLSVKDFVSTTKHVTKTEKTITELGLQNSATNLLRKNDIILSARGTVGAMAMLSKPMAFNQSCFGLRAKEGTNQDFLFYYLHVLVKQMKNMSHGSVFETITRSTFEYLKCDFPDLSVQNKIADILSSLDDKIETNRAINARLEELAAAIFKSWFIDFEPFVNEEFIEDEYGRRPKGWIAGKLTDIASITMGQSPEGNSLNTSKGVIFYQGCTEFGTRFPSIKKFTTTPTRFAEPFSVLLSVRAPVGALNVAYQKCCIGRGLASIKSKYKSYIFYSLKSYQSTLNRYNGEGTVFGCIKRSDVENIPVIIPPIEILTKFENLIQPIDNKIYNNFCQNRELSSLRDTLLPRLMSGELIPE